MAAKTLVVFDFDHTVVDGNSDTHVMKLSPDGIPKHIEAVSSWELYYE